MNKAIIGTLIFLNPEQRSTCRFHVRV